MHEYSPLLSILLNHITKYRTAKECCEVIIEEPLYLLASQKKNVIFASDLSHNVQLFMPHKNVSIDPLASPFNMSSTMFYQQVVEGKYEFWQPYLTPK